LADVQKRGRGNAKNPKIKEKYPPDKVSKKKTQDKGMPRGSTTGAGRLAKRRSPERSDQDSRIQLFRQ